MNVFALDPNPYRAANFVQDLHVNKMIIESVQLLSTCLRDLYSEEELENMVHRYMPYKQYNPNGRFVKWLKESENNYKWLFNHCTCLAARYSRNNNGTRHKSTDVLFSIRPRLDIAMYEFPDIAATDFAIACSRAIEALPIQEAYIKYRIYYNTSKRILMGKEATWLDYQPGVDESAWLNNKPYWWLDDADANDLNEAVEANDLETINEYVQWLK